MVKVMMDGAARLRGLSFRARVALFAVALAAVTLPACQQDATPDLFIGPSELGLSLTLSASPDVLPLDGASQSLVSILARDGSGQVVANVTLRLQIRVGGTLQDFGQLSARTLVTGQDGRALATYTAPLDTSGVDSQTQVEILVTPVGDNYASAVQRSLAIRLVPSGTVVPPFSLTAGFRFTPSSPVKFQVVRFETNCLSATDTNCVRGPVATYAWDFGDGSTASGSTATHTYSSALTFTVTLTLTDAFARSTSASQAVTVASPVAPTAAFVFSPAAPTTTTQVQFNGSTSSSPAGAITDYPWDFGDGSTGTGITTSHTFGATGIFTVVLTVTDPAEATGTASSTITVTGVTTDVTTASFTVSPSPTTLGVATVVDATASTAQSGETITSYAWNFGDSTGIITCPGNSSCNGALLSHTYSNAGDFTITLTVTDSAGLTANASNTVTVEGSAGTVTASFTTDPNPPTGLAVTFDASLSTSSANLALTYIWDFGDNTSRTVTAARNQHTYAASGTFVVQLTVTEPGGVSDTTSRSVVVP